MASYDYTLKAEANFLERFSGEPDIAGLPEWKEFTGIVLNTPDDQFKLLAALNRIRAVRKPARSCPKIFISHRQVDTDDARKMAWLVCDCHFEFWLDVYDPNLQSLPGNQNLTDLQKSYLTAGIIEMALINCTHVIAMITPNSPGSLWIPYEYGRITDLPTLYGRAAAWLHPQFDKTKLAEYLYLGVITENEQEIRNWLGQELTCWPMKTTPSDGSDCSCKNGSYPGKLPIA